jgi:DUF2934 family protein
MAKQTTSSPRKRTTTKKPNGDVAEVPRPNGQSGPAEVDPTEDDIRLRAYHRYLERGGEHGGDFDDWVEAEKDLRLPRHN